MNVGMWAAAPDITGTPFSGATGLGDRTQAPNPVVNTYRTSDGRWFYLVLPASRSITGASCARFWVVLSSSTTSGSLTAPPATPTAVRASAALDAVFGAKTMDEVHRLSTGSAGCGPRSCAHPRSRTIPRSSRTGSCPPSRPATGTPSIWCRPHALRRRADRSQGGGARARSAHRRDTARDRDGLGRDRPAARRGRPGVGPATVGVAPRVALRRPSARPAASSALSTRRSNLPVSL